MIEHTRSNDLFLADWLDYIQNKLGREQWVYVYSDDQDEQDHLNFALFYCALIPNEMVNESLRDNDWDLLQTDGRPYCSVTTHNGTDVVTYSRGRDNGVEPLVLLRDFHRIKPDYVEIAEEFRLFHNLYYDRAAERFTMIDQAGDEEDVIVFEGKKVKIKLKQLKQFLAAKEMHLAVLFSIDRYSDKTLKDLGLSEVNEKMREQTLAYDYYVKPVRMLVDDKHVSGSRLLGKKLIPGSPKKPVTSPWDDVEQDYEQFIIGTDDDGEPATYTCDPDQLFNASGANRGAPIDLTPVFFRPAVLTKYYNNPGKYSIEDGRLRCGGLWSMRIDNNHDKYVIVSLGHLGHDLPHKEQVYWKSYNVPPDGTISETNFRRNFLGEWAESSRPDLVFKASLENFQSKWERRFGWLLFKPLSQEDAHNLASLRVPVTNDQQEFDQQTLALTKVLIDSLNEEEMKGQLLGTVPKNSRGIDKLSLWLQANGLTDSEPHVKFLRNLQDLRNGAGHRKGDNYARGATYFGLDEKSLSEAFQDILNGATDFVKYLDDRLLTGSVSES